MFSISESLEPIEGIEVASYIGFDNTGVGAISAYSVVDYLGGPGILDLSKVEAGKMELEPTEVNLKMLVDKGLTMVKEKAMEAGCIGYIAKPINTRSFLETVSGFLAHDDP
jgi:ABC-type sugar transport system substrate-binding protein